MRTASRPRAGFTEIRRQRRLLWYLSARRWQESRFAAARALRAPARRIAAWKRRRMPRSKPCLLLRLQTNNFFQIFCINWADSSVEEADMKLLGAAIVICGVLLCCAANVQAQAGTSVSGA